MKILTRYILKEHIAPFFFSFLTITFLLVIDLVPKLIDRVIDKDIDPLIVFELLGLNLAWMLALSVPMSILVATLMAFGRLSADFEITAVKASGINMVNVLLPLLLAGSVVTYGMVQFNDKILPDLNKKARMLLGDIQSMRPTLVFQSGIFVTDIPGYLVLIDKIDHATSFVEGVRITDRRDPNRPQLIIAANGYLEVTDGGMNLRFLLNDGEIHTLDIAEPDNYRKMDFEHHTINVSGTGSELVRSDSEYRTDREMDIDQMRANVDRAQTSAEPLRKNINVFLNERFDHLFADSFVSRIPDTAGEWTALSHVESEAAVMLRHVERNFSQIDAQNRIMAKYDIEIQKKYSIPAATLAFILVGAPLGIMARRGGMGVAVGIAMVMFMIYWAFLIGGEDIADRGIVSPFWAMWSANILIGSVGLYLNYLVITEKPIFGWFRRQR